MPKYRYKCVFLDNGLMTCNATQFGKYVEETGALAHSRHVNRTVIYQKLPKISVSCQLGLQGTAHPLCLVLCFCGLCCEEKPKANTRENKRH